MSTVTPGTKFGPYEVLAQIGEGGMGAVYRAMDTRLGREVAIKISAERFTQRFERESRAVAALNHPNICTLHDVGPNYLVMELVEGKTLDERIKAGALPLDEAMGIARQIAAALEAAHDKGIVHRDLKPANIKIKPDGTVKVLDFGLARIADPTAELQSELKTGALATMEGMILGTAGYMSPEQARGLTADKRADIWAFGVVLYEMLTGQGSFHGDTVPDMLAAVLTREPDWNRVPAQAQTLLRRCLEKDPQRRLRDIGDALPLLGLVPEGAQSIEKHAASARRTWFWPAIAATAAALALLLASIHFLEPAETADPVRFSIALPRRVSLVNQGSFAISPDGRKLAFGAIGSDGARRLWLRNLDSLEFRVLQEAAINNPALLFWSADSRFIAYQDASNNLMRIEPDGGPPVRVAQLPQTALGGGSWSAADVIIFGTSEGVMQVPASGGKPVLVTATAPAEIHWNPRFAPDGKRFLYMRIVANEPDKLLVRLGLIDSPPEKQSDEGIPSVVAPEYVPPYGSHPGRLVYMRDTTLLAATFDLDSFELRGDPVTVAENVGFFNARGQALFSVSNNGVLVYGSTPRQDAQFTWFNRRGEMIGRIGESGFFGTIALSPDGTRVATGMPDLQTRGRDIWVFDLVNGGSSRLTFNPGIDQQPLWSRDGTRIVFASNRDDGWGLYQKSSTGAGDEELLLKAEQATNVTDWSRDGRFVIYHTARAPRDLWILPLTGDRKPIPFLQTPADEFGARFSPDGKWILYVSNESGSNEIYVQPSRITAGAAGAPAAGKWMISKGTVGMPRWRGDGREIFYLAPNGNVMAAEVTADPVFRAGPPQALFQVPPIFLRTSANPGAQADVAFDGQRFLFAMPVLEALGEELNVTLNWQ